MVKPLLSLLLAAALALLLAPACAPQPREWTQDGCSYTITGKIALLTAAGSREWDDTLEIPAEVDGAAVTGIGAGAFSDCRYGRVVFPETITTLDEAALQGALGLTVCCTRAQAAGNLLLCRSATEVAVLELTDSLSEPLTGSSAQDCFWEDIRQLAVLNADDPVWHSGFEDKIELCRLLALAAPAEAADLGERRANANLLVFSTYYSEPSGGQYRFALYENGLTVDGAGEAWVLPDAARQRLLQLVDEIYAGDETGLSAGLTAIDEIQGFRVRTGDDGSDFTAPNEAWRYFDLLEKLSTLRVRDGQAAALPDLNALRADTLLVELTTDAGTLYLLRAEEAVTVWQAGGDAAVQYVETTWAQVSTRALLDCADPESVYTPAMGKPVIYLYPEQGCEATVSLALNGTLGCSWPLYRDGWRVWAEPDGSLTDLTDGRRYNSLFWEGTADAVWHIDSGFVVKREDTERFLLQTLLQLGLTDAEANEFIVYWAPLLRENACNLISFDTAQYEAAARLTVTPQPDTVLRVFMTWRACEPDAEVAPQTLPEAPARTGFTVVEWGGSRLD